MLKLVLLRLEPINKKQRNLSTKRKYLKMMRHIIIIVDKNKKSTENTRRKADQEEQNAGSGLTKSVKWTPK